MDKDLTKKTKRKQRVYKLGFKLAVVIQVEKGINNIQKSLKSLRDTEKSIV